MRNGSVLFGLFFIGHSCSVLLAAPTRASNNFDVESTHAEQWDSNGKRTLQADDSERTLAEERSMTQALLPAAEAFGKTKLPETTVPRASLGSKLNPMTWLKRIWYKLRLWNARFRLAKLKVRTSGENSIDRATLEGLTPLYLKKLKNEIFRYSSSVPRDKVQIEDEYDTFVTKYFRHFDGLFKEKPVTKMGKWDKLVRAMTRTGQLAMRAMLRKVGRTVDKGYSNEKLISLDVSPLLYMRLLVKRGVFTDVEHNKAKIDRLKNYVKAYKEHVMVSQPGG
uniref:Secreted RxLR effector protein 152 n=1 Tax=Plasmopara viticola TaxID=143451 RepID=RL152_PLAVT|nr:RecName: Full=Secreted RxLR effector protein 152; Flags: Precursor [Plasmopara viticola]